jgi:outer membrane immunogenic protein
MNFAALLVGTRVMKLLSGILGLTLSSVVALASANAADMYRAPEGVGGYKDGPVPYVNWTGFYVGGNVGYGWGANTGSGYTSFSDPGVGGVASFFSSGGNVLPGVSPAGVLGGGQIGYDYQVSSKVVAGFVADIQAADIKASGSGSSSIGNFKNITESNSAQVDWFGTVRAKLGFLVTSNLLVYGTGGLAYGEVKGSTGLNDPSFNGGANPISFAGSKTLTRTGWAAGAGLEYALTPKWIVGVEYLHVDLGSISVTETQATGAVSTGDTFTSKSKFSDDIARLLVNYKFTPGYEPLK